MSSGPAVSDLIAEARAALRAGAPARAGAALDRALAAPALRPGARWEIAPLLVRLGARDRALALLGPALGRRQRRLRAELIRARLLLALGHGPAGRQALQDLATAHPGDPRPALALAEHLRGAGQRQAALDALGPHARAPAAQALRARLQAETGDRDAARAALDTFDPRDPAQAVAAARVLARLGDAGGECAVLATALDAARAADAPPDPGLCDYLLARAYSEAPKPALAARGAALTEALGADRAGPLLREISLYTGDFDTALASARACPCPRRPAQVVQLARALGGMQRRALAQRYLWRAHRAWPADAEVIRALFMQMRTSGDLDGIARLLAGLDRRTPALAALHDSLALTHAILCGAVLPQARLDRLIADPLPDSATMTALLQYLIVQADAPRAARLEAAMRAAGTLRRAPHWRSSLMGQQATELRLTQDHLGAARLAALTRAGRREIAAEMRAAPWSTVLARLMVQRQLRHAAAPPATTPSVPAQTPRRIPAVIFQYWNAPDPPAPVARMMDSWRALPGHRHRRFDRRAAMGFLRDAFGPAYLRAFQMAKSPAEEADFLRLCLIARHGGIWADADDRLLGTLAPLIAGTEALVVSYEPYSGAIENNFFAAAPRHPALRFAAEEVRDALLQRSNETAWAKTGPGLLTRAVAVYIARTPPRRLEGALRILRSADLRAQVAVHNRLFHKTTAVHWNAQEPRDPGFLGLVDRLIAGRTPDRTDG